MKQLIARASVLLILATTVLLAPTMAQAGDPIITCFGPDRTGTNAICPAVVQADLIQEVANGPIRIYGSVYAPGRYGLTLNLAIEIGGNYIFIGSHSCASGSSTCSFDHWYPCERDCIGTGWYYLTVAAFKGSTWLGDDYDSEYIICNI